MTSTAQPTNVSGFILILSIIICQDRDINNQNYHYKLLVSLIQDQAAFNTVDFYPDHRYYRQYQIHVSYKTKKLPIWNKIQFSKFSFSNSLNNVEVNFR